MRLVICCEFLKPHRLNSAKTLILSTSLTHPLNFCVLGFQLNLSHIPLFCNIVDAYWSSCMRHWVLPAVCHNPLSLIIKVLSVLFILWMTHEKVITDCIRIFKIKMQPSVSQPDVVFVAVKMHCLLQGWRLTTLRGQATNDAVNWV